MLRSLPCRLPPPVLVRAGDPFGASLQTLLGTFLHQACRNNGSLQPLADSAAAGASASTPPVLAGTRPICRKERRRVLTAGWGLGGARRTPSEIGSRLGAGTERAECGRRRRRGRKGRSSRSSAAWRPRAPAALRAPARLGSPWGWCAEPSAALFALVPTRASGCLRRCWKSWRVPLESTSPPLCLQYGDLPLNYIFILSAILTAYMICKRLRENGAGSP